jgi:hypothetical protein
MSLRFPAATRRGGEREREQNGEREQDWKNGTAVGAEPVENRSEHNLSPWRHGRARGIPVRADMRLRWSDRGDTAKAGPRGSPFPLLTRLADGLGPRK